MQEPRAAIINGKKYLLYVKQINKNQSNLRLCSKEAQKQREERRVLADVKRMVCPKLRKPTEERVLSRVYNRLTYLEKLYASLTMAEIEQSVLSRKLSDVSKPPPKRMKMTEIQVNDLSKNELDLNKRPTKRPKITEIPVNEALNLLKQSGITVNPYQ